MPRRLNQPDSLLETRGKIIAMKDQGKTKREIANEVGLSAIRRSGRISCGFWGWMCAAGSGETVPIVGRFTAEQYRDILDQLLLFASDGVATMLSVGELLKKDCANLLHVTCKIHVLPLVAETIRDFHRLCPDIPEPPHQILTRWETWLQAAFYYNEHFESVKNVVLQFNPKEAAVIPESQSKFQNSVVKTDLNAIQSNYGGFLEAIQKLENSSESLLESMQIVKDVHA
ncbi:hypothetical protein MML48_3g00012685 [Holotrichia oblita]|uniref:Uncharacterized protein n=1 Tax=Holotrichia oblita TaxID=644536 RepID=A0ACB9TDY2_HOLOL|nr:hypothetical protein MML48_3g00012685 [Holotrichia oblita]